MIFQKILLFFLAFLPTALCAQEMPLQFTHFGAQEGLSNSQVNVLLQDQFGFLWVGTEDGLNRYDGQQFKVYRYLEADSTSLSNSFIIALFEDKDGLLWVGTRNGLNRYDPASESFERFMQMDDNDPAGQNYIHNITQDQLGFIWYGTYNGLYRLNPISGEHLRFMPEMDKPFSISNPLVWEMLARPDGSIWIGTHAGLNILQPYSSNEGFRFINYQHDPENPRSLSSNRVWAFTNDSDGKVWMGTYNGLSSAREQADGSLVFERHLPDPDDPQSLSYGFVDCVHADNTGQLWVGTYNGGLNRADINSTNNGPLRFDHYKHDLLDPKSLPSNEVRAILKDRSGILWVGTNAGLSKADPQLQRYQQFVSTPGKSNSLSNNTIQAILEDSRGNLWVGTRNGGLNLLPAGKEQEGFIHYSQESGHLLHNDVFGLYEDGEGYLWVGTYLGLSYFKIDQIPALPRRGHFDSRSGLPHQFIYSIREKTPHEYWITTYGGLAQMIFNPNQPNLAPQFTSFESDNRNPRSFINSCSFTSCIDRFGQLWIGTFSGISKYIPPTTTDTAYFESYLSDENDTSSLSNNMVNQLFKDRRGRMWAATLGGLNLIVQTTADAPVHFTRFGIAQGLPNDNISNILEDGSGYLWLTSSAGLLVFDPDIALMEQTDRSSIIKVLDHRDGLLDREFNLRASIQGNKGQFYWGSNKGISIFHPEQLHFNRFVPPVVLTDFNIFNQSVNPGSASYDAKHSPLDESILVTDTLCLDYWQNDFSFEFAALSFATPQKNQFAFQMEGFNQDWVYSGNKSTAHYTNLDPGSYRFRVKAANNDGVWNEEGRSMTIVILPPPWKSWWAYCLYLLLAGSLIYGFIRFRIKRRLAQLEAEVRLTEARTEERERIRQKNAADFHDELGHKLTKLSLFVGLAGQQAKGDDQLEEYLGKTEGYVKELSGGIRDFIWALDPEKDSMYQTLLRLQEFGDQLFEHTDVKFRVHGISQSFEAITIDLDTRRQIVLIFKEVMNNCLKHADCENATFSASIVDKQIIIRFADDGKGFDENAKVAGYGLKNMVTRAAKIGGTLELIAQEGAGCRVNLKIPQMR